MKIYIYKSELSGQFWFDIVARNGEIIAVSEMYHNKKDCKKTAKKIVEQAAKAILVDSTQK